MSFTLTGTVALFTGTGAPANLTPGFFADTSSQVKVTANGVLKTLGSDYTITGLGDPLGIQVHGTFAAASKVIVRRDTPITQSLDVRNNETLLETVLETALDFLTMVQQETQADADRAFTVPYGELGSMVPSVASRADRVVAFDHDGNIYAPAVSAANLETLAGVAAAIAIVAANIAAVLDAPNQAAAAVAAKNTAVSAAATAVAAANSISNLASVVASTVTLAKWTEILNAMISTGAMDAAGILRA